MNLPESEEVSIRNTVPKGRQQAKRKGGGARKNRQVHVFLVLALPALALYVLGVISPLALSVKYSFTDLNLLSGKGEWVGLKNYVDVLTDPEFWNAFWFTATLTACCVMFANLAGVTMAVILNRNLRVFHILRSITFIPSVLAGVVVAYIWSTMLTDRGILNSILGSVGLTGLETSWLGAPQAAQASVIFVTVWPSIGFATIIYLAGLQSIPRELIEAAAVDGAGPARIFRSVTWPLLRPPLFVTSTMMLIGGFKSYDISVVLTAGGPSRATDTPAYQIIRHGFLENRAGYANAEAVILLLILLAISIITARLGSRGEK